MNAERGADHDAWFDCLREETWAKRCLAEETWRPRCYCTSLLPLNAGQRQAGTHEGILSTVGGGGRGGQMGLPDRYLYAYHMHTVCVQSIARGRREKLFFLLYIPTHMLSHIAAFYFLAQRHRNTHLGRITHLHVLFPRALRSERGVAANGQWTPTSLVISFGKGGIISSFFFMRCRVIIVHFS